MANIPAKYRAKGRQLALQALSKAKADTKREARKQAARLGVPYSPEMDRAIEEGARDTARVIRRS